METAWGGPLFEAHLYVPIAAQQFFAFLIGPQGARVASLRTETHCKISMDFAKSQIYLRGTQTDLNSCVMRIMQLANGFFSSGMSQRRAQFVAHIPRPYLEWMAPCSNRFVGDVMQTEQVPEIDEEAIAGGMGEV